MDREKASRENGYPQIFPELMAGIRTSPVIGMLKKREEEDFKKYVANEIFKEIDKWLYFTTKDLVCVVVDKKIYQQLKDRFYAGNEDVFGRD